MPNKIIQKGEFVTKRPLFKAFAGEKKEDGSTRKYNVFNTPEDIDLYQLYGVYYLYYKDKLVYIGRGVDEQGVMHTIARHFQKWNDTQNVDRPTFKPSELVSYEVQTFDTNRTHDVLFFEVQEIAKNTPKLNYINNPESPHYNATVEDVVGFVVEDLSDGNANKTTEAILNEANEEFNNEVQEKLDKIEKLDEEINKLKDAPANETESEEKKRARELAEAEKRRDKFVKKYTNPYKFR